MDRSLIPQEWFQRLVEDCKAIVVEGEFVSRWALVETYHEVGKRILVEHDNFRRESIYGKQVSKNVGEAIGRSKRTIEYAIQFAKKYPELNEAPFEKNISWTRIVNEYLPEQPREVVVRRCPHCGEDLAKEATEQSRSYHRHPDSFEQS